MAAICVLKGVLEFPSLLTVSLSSRYYIKLKKKQNTSRNG